MSLRITLRQLEYFLAVGDCGSIALAAKTVNVSSPSISAAIAQLEAEFGLQLFVRRHAQGLALTPGGARFMAQARTVLAQAAALNELANDITGTVRGPLHVGCLLTFGQILLPQLRRSFIDAFPDVVFRQYDHDQQGLFDQLRAARLDIALSYDLNIPADIQFTPLMDLPPFALVDEHHPLAGRAVVTVQDLLPFPMILLDLPMSADYFLSFFLAQGLSPHIAERTRDIAMMRSLVANGFGYGLANIRPLSDLAPDGRKLCFLPLCGPSAGPVKTLRLGLLSPKEAPLPRTVRAFLEHARATLTPERAPLYQVRPPASHTQPLAAG